MISDVEPKKVMKYFEQICAIPHGSGHTEQISDYLVHYAREHGFACRQDQQNNVILFCPGTPGYEDHPPVMLQGHMDMVCEKEDGNEIDFLTQGVTPVADGGWIRADGTTLGGDDGIALAMGLALAEDDAYPHPPLELVFTVDEEIGLLGAAHIDVSCCRARTMINLDSEEEGLLLCGCAGGADAVMTCSPETEKRSGLLCELAVSGLTGGHSGAEIHQGRANANKIMGRLLAGLGSKAGGVIVGMEGGTKANAIPRKCVARLVIDPSGQDVVRSCVEDRKRAVKEQYGATDPEMDITCSFGGTGDWECYTEAATEQCIRMLRDMPDGVISRCEQIDLVETSQNLSIVRMNTEQAYVLVSVRSSVDSKKEEQLDKWKALAASCGFSTAIEGDYPGWEYDPDSKLLRVMTRVYREQYGSEPRTGAIHAGVECGYFVKKIPGLDCVSIGPDIPHIHTPGERLSIPSTQRVFAFLCGVLKQL